jgi:hypothetical protein
MARNMVVRISAEQHQELTEVSTITKQSIEEMVSEALETYLECDAQANISVAHRQQR